MCQFLNIFNTNVCDKVYVSAAPDRHTSDLTTLPKYVVSEERC